MRGLYPEHAWDHSRFSVHAGRAAQHSPQTFLKRIITSLFPPPISIQVNERSLPLVGAHNANLELDIYLPELHLAFEYQVSLNTKRLSPANVGTRILITILILIMGHQRCLNIMVIER